MRKYIAIIEGRGIKKYNLSKVTLPMTTIRSHLYRTDERLFHLDKGGDQAIEFTELESTQVFGDGEYLNPDETIAILDTAPNLNKKVANWSALTNGGGMGFLYTALGIIMVIYVVYAIITGKAGF